ncbi:hypothetical protein ACIQVU_19970 [Lysinibacillus sp. NPDC098008]|uniref:hypothetical protein n=1 Tax=Lysinibacillus sp. NPDC098008 TaxID=3364146 RepID=UPI00382AE377
MDKIIKDMFPAWVNQKQEGHYTIYGNDVDSAYSNTIIHNLFGYTANAYVDRKGFYIADKTINKYIGIDLAVISKDIKTWDNHVTLIDSNDRVNPNSANINSIMMINHDKNYYKKCALSTALQMIAYYDLPLPSTIDGKRALLAIDGGYKGFYSKKFKNTYISYLKMLGLDNLLDVLDRSKESDFEKALPSEKLIFKDGLVSFPTSQHQEKLEKLFETKFYIPQGKFELSVEFKNNFVNRQQYHKFNDKAERNTIFSLAVLNKDKISFSQMTKIHK